MSCEECKINEYDLIVVGGGAAGFSASIEAKKRGKKVVLINDEKTIKLGGTCVNIGCVPSKVLIELGRNRFYKKEKIDFVEALAKARELINELRERNYEKVVRDWGIEVINGKAKIVDMKKVEVNGKEITGKNILISTGAEPNIPNIEGLKDFLTHKKILDLKEKPKSIVILGGGAIASEYAQILNYFGIKTTIIQRSERILKRFEKESSEFIMKKMREEGIEIYTNTQIEGVEGNKVIFKQNKEKREVEADRIMVATGIKGRIDGLGLEDIGVNVERGFIKVDENLRTNLDNIYAAGDVTGIMPLETVAAKQGKIAVMNMLGENKKIKYDEIPFAVFTYPEIAQVGKKEGESRKLMLNEVEKGVIKNSEGFIKMYAKENRVRGIEIVSENASEFIAISSLIVKNEIGLDSIRETSFVFPTLSEMIKKVAQSFSEDLGKMPCCFE